MNYRSLGRTGVQVSELCLGCGHAQSKDWTPVIDKALDAGINFLDTANSYGKSEEVVGEALKKGGKRDGVVLATKVWASVDASDPNMRGSHRRHIIHQCEQSLKRLQTDWIDLYQMHNPSPAVPIDETLGALDDLVRQGKVRYIGSSSFAGWQLVESLWASRELRLNRFICEQPPYHLLDRTAEREVIPACMSYGIGIIPWSPLAEGFLTGKFKRGDPFPDNSRVTQGGRKYTEAAYVVVDAVVELAQEKGCTAGQLALAWCRDQPGVTSPIIGPRTPEQLDNNLGASEVRLTDADHARLDEAAPPGCATVPYYRADWSPGRFRW